MRELSTCRLENTEVMVNDMLLTVANNLEPTKHSKKKKEEGAQPQYANKLNL
jgi:hypothetical protein